MSIKTVRVIFVMMIIMCFMSGVAWAGDVNKKDQIQALEAVDASLQEQIDNLTPGPIGPQGEQGETGLQGDQGIQGIQGETGSTGPQGIQGETGSTGPQGIQGEPGPRGASGPPSGPGPASGFISVSFLPGVDAWDNRTRKVTNMWDTINDDLTRFANADTSEWWVGRSAFYSSFVPGEKAPIYVPVQIPDGAVVVKFGLLYYDEDGGDSTESMAYLQRISGDSSGLRLATIYRAAVGSTQLQHDWTTNINPDRAVIDNSAYGYHIRGVLRAWQPTALLAAFVEYEMGPPSDPPGGGDVDYSGMWTVSEYATAASCDDLGQQELYTMQISHVGNDVTFFPSEPDPVTGQLVGNTVTIDTVNGADSFHAFFTFTSAVSFEAEFVEYWANGTCFKKATMDGWK